MVVINRGSDQGYDSWDENTQQAERGEVCRGEKKKESVRHPQQVKMVCRAGIFPHLFGPTQMIVKR